MKISDLASKYSISTRTLRYYEDIGLIKSIRTDQYAYRLYDQEAIRRIEQIVLLRKLQTPIKDIRKIFASNSWRFCLMY